MITRNEKAKGLWWRLLATLPVLAILLVANTKVTAQEQQPEKKQINVEIGQFEIFDDFGNPMNLTDTIIYNEDGSYVQFKTTEAPDPITGEMRNKITATSCNADGTPNKNIQFTINAIEKHGDTTMYTVEPFTLDADNFRLSIQTTEDNPIQVIRNSNDSIYNIVEQMPQFPGGEQAMMEFVAKNIEYPQKAKDNNIQGRVFIQFVVEKDGSINEVKLLRGIGGGCDEAAVRVVKAMPKWKPGMQKGEPVRVSYMMPVNFKLKEDKSSKTANKVDANEPDMKPDKNGVYQIVEEMPRFPGDDKALREYLKSNLEVPEKYKNDDSEFRLTEYRTFVRFIVTEDGSVSDVKIIKKTEGFKDLDEEALRVVKAMPKWNPGKMNGKPVKVYFNLPVIFKFNK